MRVLRSPDDGATLDASATMYPSRLVALRSRREFTTPTSTHYGYCVAGKIHIAAEGIDAALSAGGFFALPGAFEARVEGLTVAIERFGFRCAPLLGRVEARGRLAYIDGCSDTVLCAPPRLGDPVLNHLHFPAGIRQSLHTHPSIRLGVVARGGGLAFGQRAMDGADFEEALIEGAVFAIDAHERHAFRTEKGASMDVIAFHPDSDWGPTDGAHPMLNRTYLAK